MLPIPAAHREILVKVQGQAVSREHQLLAATVTKSVNKIAAARLVYLDGSASASDFPLSSGDTFVPGNEVEILAGTTSDPVSLFKGIVVSQSLQVRERGAPQLVIECRHKAVKLAQRRKSVCFSDQKDSEIITSLLEGVVDPAEVEDTTVQHARIVQFRATDWDFLLTRAQANGKLVLTNGAGIAVKKPPFDGASKATLLFGSTILELDAQIDARSQRSGIAGVSWDPAQQALVRAEAENPGIKGPGNFTSDDLAQAIDPEPFELTHAAIAEDEAQAWADAELVWSRMTKVSGRVKCEGMTAANPGDIVTLSGAGARFSGPVFVTGVRHDSVGQDWKTHLQFGAIERWTSDVRSASAAGGLLPNISGLHLGVVVALEDADGEERVCVELLLVKHDGGGIWARVASPDAGDDRGFFFRPEVGDEVVVGFLDDDPRHAVILGMLHSSAKPAPLKASDANPEKLYQSRSKMRLSFNDETKVLGLETPAGNAITLSEDDKAITIKDQNGNSIKLDADGITIESKKAVKLDAGTELKIAAKTSAEIDGGNELKASAKTSAELGSSSGNTTINGTKIKLG